MSSGRIRRVMAYHPDQYWQGLLDERFDFSGVGHPEFPPAFNRVLYHQMRLAVLAATVEHGIDVEDADVLEIGPGTGYWVDLWDELGARSVHGLDIAVSAVDRLRAAYPRHRFQEGDLGSPHLPIDGSFDLISAMSVLLHIVDERRFQTALTHMASRLRPGGTVLLMEPLVLHRWWGPPVDASSNSRARTLAEWNEALASRGAGTRRPPTGHSTVGQRMRHSPPAGLVAAPGLLGRASGVPEPVAPTVRPGWETTQGSGRTRHAFWPGAQRQGDDHPTCPSRGQASLTVGT